MSPDSALMITVDEGFLKSHSPLTTIDGRALLVNFKRRVVLHHHNFKETVNDIQFSPDGKFFAVALKKQVQLWKAPGFTMEFSPFVLHHTYTGHFDDIVTVQWSPDSEYFITGSLDMTARIYTTNTVQNYVVPVLSGHRDSVIGAWFTNDQQVLYTLGKDGALFEWKQENTEFNQQEENAQKRSKINNGLTREALTRWRISQKHYFMQNHAKVSCCGYQRNAGILAVGFTTGVFGIYELPDFVNIHSLR